MTFRTQISSYKSDGRHALRIKIQHLGKKVYLPINISIRKSHFKNGYCKGSSMDTVVNNKIDLVLNELKTIAIKNNDFEPKQIKEFYLNGGVSNTERILVEDLINMKAENYDVEVSKSTFISKCKAFTEFKPGIYVDEITHDILTKYELHLRNDRKNNETTIHSNFVKLKAAINYGVYNDLIKSNPVLRYKLTTPKSEPKTIHSIEQIKKLESLDLSGRKRDSINMYLFLFYSHGSRISEILLLKWKHIDETQLSYKPPKTKKKNNKIKYVHLNDGLRRIISRLKKGDKEDYVFDFLKNGKGISSATSLINKTLKQVVADLNSKLKDKDIKWDEFSTSSARHSFSTILFNSGTSKVEIGRLLLHTKESTTETYLKSIMVNNGEGILNKIMENGKD